MNWVKENKFLTGFLIVLLLGVGGLGFEIYSASSASDDATAAYNDKAAEYSRLRHLIPFPNKKNLDTYEDRKKEAAQAIDAFEEDLSKKAFPLTTLTPERFQDKLKAAVTEVRDKATQAGVKLPEKGFFLGFERYETTPPTAEAATPLGRQLDAIKWIVDQYISNSVQEISLIARPELPEEKAGGAENPSSRNGLGQPGGGPGAGGPGGPGKGGRAGADRNDLVAYYPFQLTAVCRQQKIASILDAVSSAAAPQFYVVRRVRILNQNPKGPSKVADPTKTDKALDYIVGQELNEFIAEYDIVIFTPPTEKTAAAGSPTTKRP
jgi:hypothetical protein